MLKFFLFSAVAYTFQTCTRLLKRALLCCSVHLSIAVCTCRLQRELVCCSMHLSAAACTCLLRRALVCCSMHLSAAACTCLLPRALVCCSGGHTKASHYANTRPDNNPRPCSNKQKWGAAQEREGGRE